MRHLLFVFTTLALALPVSAQNTSIGAKLGLLSANTATQTAGNQVAGFRAGGFLTHSISQEFGIGGELNLARKGARLTPNQSLRLDYLEVPIFAQYFFGEGGLRPKVIAGPYFARLLQAKSGEQSLNNYAQDDYGFLLGIGFHQRLGNSRWLYADLRYTHGLAELRPGSDQFNRDLSLNVGISFPLNLPR